MNRVAEIIEQATVLEDLPGTGRIVRASQIRVIRSEAMRHSEELVCLILAEGISLRDGMALTFKAEDLAEQCANMGLSADQFMRLLLILKDLNEKNPFAPATRWRTTTNTLFDLLPPDEPVFVPLPNLTPIRKVA